MARQGGYDHDHAHSNEQGHGNAKSLGQGYFDAIALIRWKDTFDQSIAALLWSQLVIADMAARKLEG